MANNKKISTVATTGWTLYVVIRREADGALLNDADGTFSAGPADPYLSLSEDGTYDGLFEVIENRTSWNDGAYLVLVYRQIGAGPVPGADTLLSIQEYYIKSDAKITPYSVLPMYTTGTLDELLSAHTTASTVGALLNRVKVQFGLT